MGHDYKVIDDNNEFTILELAFKYSKEEVFKYFCDKIGADQVKTNLSEKWPTENDLVSHLINNYFSRGFVTFFTRIFDIDLYKEAYEYNGVKGDARVLIKPQYMLSETAAQLMNQNNRK